MQSNNPNLERDNEILAWQEAAQQLEAIKQRELALRNAVFARNFPNAKVGVNNFDLGLDYTLKGTRKLNYNLANGKGETDTALEQIEALGNEGAFIADRLVTYKPSLSISEYKKLDSENPTHVKIKAIIDSVLTITDGAPTLELVPPKRK